MIWNGGQGSNTVEVQVWNHPGLLQMAKEQRGNLRREDAVENFMMDESSSDDNVENYLPNGGNLLYPTVNNTHQGLANLHIALCVII